MCEACHQYSSAWRRHGRPLRRGVVTLEVILAFPILIIATLAIFEFGMLMLVQQTIATAATEGARAAAREATPDAANVAALRAVNQVLSVHNLAIDPSNSANLLTDAKHSGDYDGVAPNNTTVALLTDAKLIVEYGGMAPMMTGDPMLNCQPPTSPPMTAAEVRVTVCIDLTTTPLINLLSGLGLDLMGQRMEISSLASLEN